MATLAQTGSLEEHTEFISGTITYAIKSSNATGLSADYKGSSITLYVPQQQLENWSDTDLVGIEYNMPLQNGNTLYLLLEKDFKCIDGDITDDQSDYFENPHLTC